VHSDALAGAQGGVQGGCCQAGGDREDNVFLVFLINLLILLLLVVMMNVVTVSIPIFTVLFSQRPRLSVLGL
jgi:hypothetical protein